MNPAGLNFGDCFAYELAKTRNCRLLLSGMIFAKTDLKGVL
jgi:ribonuclease VapC